MSTTVSVENRGTSVDEKSLEQLQAVLHRYCLSLTASAWDAEDLAQDTWLKAMEQLQKLGHVNPEAFLLRIAKNTWIDQSRRKTVLNRILSQDLPKKTLSENRSYEIELTLQALVKHLSPLQRTVFLLRDVFGYSIAETADFLKTTAGAVKAAHHRAHQSLNDVKEELDHDGPSLPEDQRMKAYFRTLATAYQMGDIATLIYLAQQGDIPAFVPIRITRNQQLKKSIFTKNTDPQLTARMAA